MAAVQTCTVVQPSSMNSAASRQPETPPMPEMGRPASGSEAICCTRWSAVLENWGHADLAKKYITEQKVAQDAGPTGNIGKIGWYVPPFLAKAHQMGRASCRER